MVKWTLLLFMSLLTLYPGSERVLAGTCAASSPNISLAEQRQLAALRNMLSARGCTTSESHGGFFNACRDITNRISELQRATGQPPKPHCRTAVTRTKPKMIQVSASQPTRKVSYRDDSYTTKPFKEKIKVVSEFQPQRRRASKALRYCVRLSDGYLFPSPNSQYRQKGGDDAALEQCRFICETEDIDLYVLNDPRKETAEMVSIKTGRPYDELPSAYKYQREGEFKKCDWARYIDAVRGQIEEKKAAKLGIPLPSPMPPLRPSSISIAPAISSIMQVSAYTSTSSISTMSQRKIRVVGPTWMLDHVEPRRREPGKKQQTISDQ
ncbi:DUF2865 domain-containing protein [Ochrobactrum sp. GPK 3]|uniref:DUF2865 domain-containing protein n=1 Tax=Brucella sp. 22210 TaxID=3453892 RepID=UPI003138604E